MLSSTPTESSTKKVADNTNVNIQPRCCRKSFNAATQTAGPRNATDSINAQLGSTLSAQGPDFAQRTHVDAREAMRLAIVSCREILSTMAHESRAPDGLGHSSWSLTNPGLLALAALRGS